MKYETIKRFNPGDFRRLTGITQEVFTKMITVLEEAEKQKKYRGGKPNILCMEDRLLMALEYWREYRTYFHIANNYGVSESTCCRNICWIENTLIRHPEFSLPGKKELLKGDHSIEVVVIDVAETPIERPKKIKDSTIQAKRKDIH